MTSVVDIHMKNGIRPEYDVYIGRSIRYHKTFKKDSKWRNRSKTLEDYEAWVIENLWHDLEELRDKRLGCWCVTTAELEPVQCHGQILMKLIALKCRICDDCAKFDRPSWLMDMQLGICSEGMFGYGEPSDKNDSACEHFKEKEEKK